MPREHETTPDIQLLRLHGRLTAAANGLLLTPTTRRELRDIAAELLPIAAPVARMRRTLDELVEDARESAAAAEQAAGKVVSLRPGLVLFTREVPA